MKTLLEIDYDEDAVGVEELVKNLESLLSVNKVTVLVK